MLVVSLCYTILCAYAISDAKHPLKGAIGFHCGQENSCAKQIFLIYLFILNS